MKRRTNRRRGSVVVYEGKRGTVWRIKYRDATGRQVMETLGSEWDGWDEKKAEAELRERLVRVEQKGYRRPEQLSFGEYARRWLAEGERLRGWKPLTVRTYRPVLARLVAHFGTRRLGDVRPADVAGYVRKTAATLGPATVNRDLSILHAIFDTAVREELVDANPATKAERPRLPAFRPRILKPGEIQAVLHAFTELIRETTEAEGAVESAVDRAWQAGMRQRYEQARVVFLTLVLTGLRRFELQGLRWRAVDLIDNVLRVEDSKSEDGVRSIALSAALVEELWQHRRRSAFQGDNDLVFCHPDKGTVLRPAQWQPLFDAALAKAEIRSRIRPFHDLRHTAITNDAASGSSAIAVMTKAGHASFKTTKQYLHLAGVVFRQEADALEERVLRPRQPSTETGAGFYPASTNLSEPQTTEDDPPPSWNDERRPSAA